MKPKSPSDELTLFVLKAAGTKVDDLDGAFPRMPQENVLRLEIAMYDTMMAHEAERQECLRRETADEAGRETGKIVGLDELIEIDAEELHCDAQVVAEIERLGHFDDVELLVWIPLGKIFKNLDLDKCLVVEPLLVSNQLDGYRLTRLMIPALKHLAKRASTKEAHNLVPERQVIMIHD